MWKDCHVVILRPPSIEVEGGGPFYSYTLGFTIQLRKVMENLGKQIGIVCLAARTSLLVSIFHWLQPQARTMWRYILAQSCSKSEKNAPMVPSRP
jgi:hypothetical protein